MKYYVNLAPGVVHRGEHFNYRLLYQQKLLVLLVFSIS